METSMMEPAMDRDVERAKERLDEAVLNVAHAAREYYDDTEAERYVDTGRSGLREELKEALDEWKRASDEFLRLVSAAGQGGLL